MGVQTPIFGGIVGPTVYTDGVRSNAGGRVPWPGWGGSGSFTLVAEPNAGYHFDHWDYSGSGYIPGEDWTSHVSVSGATLSVGGTYEKEIGDGSVPITITVRAYFASDDEPEPQVFLTVAKVGAGSVAPAVGRHAYARGSVVRLSATETDAAYGFDHWIIDGARIDSPTTSVTMSADRSATAYFELKYHGILYSPSSGGRVLCSEAGSVMRI